MINSSRTMKNILEIFSTEECGVLGMHNIVERPAVVGEDKYMVLGQTSNGRYLAIFYIGKLDKRALIVSARDMVDKERKAYERK